MRKCSDAVPTSSGTKNIFLTSREAGDVKVGDFGLSRALSQSTSELALTVCGTPFYLSPELVSGSPYGVPADLWSLGVVLFELLTLQRPFVAPNFAALIQEVMACSYDESLLTRCGEVVSPAHCLTCCHSNHTRLPCVPADHLAGSGSNLPICSRRSPK